MLNGTILIIDDNPNVRSALEILLTPEYKKVLSLDAPDKIDTIEDLSEIDLVLLDMNFTSKTKLGDEGLFWLSELKKQVPEIKIIMITAYGDIELAVKAIKNGASDFILKPWKNEQLLNTLKKAYFQKTSKPKTEKVTSNTCNQEEHPLIGNHPSFLETIHLINKISKLEIDLLISGENGTGKELLAKEYHKISKRNKSPFIKMDLGATLELELEDLLLHNILAANGGILFINAIEKLPLNLQSKLLLTLQSKTISDIGNSSKTGIDIQLICATKYDLKSKSIQGEFLEDLLYRINTVTISVPPLRNRGNDIMLLAHHYLDTFKNKYQKKEIQLHPSAKPLLQKYSWPGNIRELKHCLEKAVILSTGIYIREEDLNLEEQVNFTAQNPVTLSEMELVMIEKALSDHQGNYSAAANQLGISRQTLYNKLKKLSTNG